MRIATSRQWRPDRLAHWCSLATFACCLTPTTCMGCERSDEALRRWLGSRHIACPRRRSSPRSQASGDRVSVDSEPVVQPVSGHSFRCVPAVPACSGYSSGCHHAHMDPHLNRAADVVLARPWACRPGITRVRTGACAASPQGVPCRL